MRCFNIQVAIELRRGNGMFLSLGYDNCTANDNFTKNSNFCLIP